jgi:hypothetical protein
MSSDFTQLTADIEQEAHDEGPQAVRELERLREEFMFASASIRISDSPGSREAADALDQELAHPSAPWISAPVACKPACATNGRTSRQQGGCNVMRA